MLKNLTVILSLVLLAPAGWAACAYPDSSVEMPDGSVATKDQMVAAQGEVKVFMAEMEEYLACLDAEEDAAVAAAEDAGEELSAEQQALHVKRHNAAVDAMHAVAEEFNVQVRKFQDKN